MKRVLDFLLSLFGIVLLTPVFILLALILLIDSPGPVFFRQKRVGKDGKDFDLIKFRTMKTNAEQQGQLTVGERDSRITNFGYFLRKYKLDELPQLFNVLFGQMSLVGPRPEVRKYVDLYTDKQKEVLKVLPGITDVASLKFINENELLGKSDNPEATYINQIMPEKLRMNIEYINSRTVISDIGVIFKTVLKIVD